MTGKEQEKRRKDGLLPEYLPPAQILRFVQLPQGGSCWQHTEASKGPLQCSLSLVCSRMTNTPGRLSVPSAAAAEPPSPPSPAGGEKGGREHSTDQESGGPEARYLQVQPPVRATDGEKHARDCRQSRSEPLEQSLLLGLACDGSCNDAATASPWTDQPAPGGSSRSGEAVVCHARRLGGPRRRAPGFRSRK